VRGALKRKKLYYSKTSSLKRGALQEALQRIQKQRYKVKETRTSYLPKNTAGGDERSE